MDSGAWNLVIVVFIGLSVILSQLSSVAGEAWLPGFVGSIIFAQLAVVVGAFVVVRFALCIFFAHELRRQRMLTVQYIGGVFCANYLGNIALNFLAWLFAFVFGGRAFSRVPQSFDQSFLALYNCVIYTILQLQGNSSPDNQPVSELARTVSALQSIWAVATFVGLFSVAAALACDAKRNAAAARAARPTPL